MNDEKSWLATLPLNEQWESVAELREAVEYRNGHGDVYPFIDAQADLIRVLESRLEKAETLIGQIKREADGSRELPVKDDWEMGYKSYASKTAGTIRAYRRSEGKSDD